jgi:Fic family protein
VLFVRFAAVQPFERGNGRVGRILATHVLRAVTPFPLTPFSDGSMENSKVRPGLISTQNP